MLLNSHVFSIREVTVFHVSYVRADVIREHKKKPKVATSPRKNTLFDGHVHALLFALVVQLNLASNGLCRSNVIIVEEKEDITISASSSSTRVPFYDLEENDFCFD